MAQFSGGQLAGRRINGGRRGPSERSPGCWHNHGNNNNCNGNNNLIESQLVWAAGLSPGWPRSSWVRLSCRGQQSVAVAFV